jgi:hypothetical protein
MVIPNIRLALILNFHQVLIFTRAVITNSARFLRNPCTVFPLHIKFHGRKAQGLYVCWEINHASLRFIMSLAAVTAVSHSLSLPAAL